MEKTYSEQCPRLVAIGQKVAMEHRVGSKPFKALVRKWTPLIVEMNEGREFDPYAMQEVEKVLGDTSKFWGNLPDDHSFEEAATAVYAAVTWDDLLEQATSWAFYWKHENVTACESAESA